jgi:hypothetical protein
MKHSLKLINTSKARYDDNNIASETYIEHYFNQIISIEDIIRSFDLALTTLRKY